MQLFSARVCFHLLSDCVGAPLLQSWQGEESSVAGPKIPQALEKILQLKEMRQGQLTDPTGTSPPQHTVRPALDRAPRYRAPRYRAPRNRVPCSM